MDFTFISTLFCWGLTRMTSKRQSSEKQAAAKTKKKRSTPPHPDEEKKFAMETCFETKGRFSEFVACGEGSYGSVYKAKDNRTGKYVAIKRVRDVFSNSITAKRILREVRILRVLQHRNVIAFRGLLEPENPNTFRDLFMVFDFFDTDIGKIIGSDQFITNFHVQCFMYQLLMAIKYLHSQHVIHRDLKPSNLLVNADCSLVVCDFGLARVQPPSATQQQCPLSPLKPTVCLPAQHTANVALRPPTVSFPSIANDNNNNNNAEGMEFVDLTQSTPTPTTPGDISTTSATSSSLPTAATPSIAARSLSSPTNALSTLTVGALATPTPTVSIPSKDAPSPFPPPPQGLLARTMTQHVVTRWYRAPEVNLSANYTYAIDLWSAGCIFAELLGMQKENYSTFSDRQILFPGASSAFLSPLDEGDDKEEQLNIIFNVIGTPDPDEIVRICTNPSSATQTYVNALLEEAKPGSTKRRLPKDFHAMYRGADPLAIDLLHGLLKFDPSKRLSAQQALEHPYLKRIRDDTAITDRYGRHDTNTPYLAHPTDFAFEDDTELSQSKLRKLLMSDIRYYNPTSVSSSATTTTAAAANPNSI